MTSESPREIGLVSCVKSKRDESAIPKALYTSPYFQKMRRYAEAEHDDWWILSAEHGLLDPDGLPIEPYEATLRNFSKAEREEWAARVIDAMREASLFERPTRLVVHAGKAYYEPLLPVLRTIDSVSILIPTEGLAIGERLAWYNDRLP